MFAICFLLESSLKGFPCQMKSFEQIVVLFVSMHFSDIQFAKDIPVATPGGHEPLRDALSARAP